MIRNMIVCLVCLSFACALALAADGPYRPVPAIKMVNPDTAKAGSEVTAIALSANTFPGFACKY